MPLKLVTGPANAAKAGEVLGGLRARLDEDPILVVPSFEDVEHAQRELAERGAVFGAGVVRFARLFRMVAERAGYVARVASGLQQTLLVEEAVRGAGLSELAASAERPGFVRATRRFVAELGRSMVEPPRLTRALRDWAGEGPRRTYADEVARIYSRYRDGLDAAGLVDAELFAWRALDALRVEPRLWGRSPVFAYGFDDFTRLELDALETLAGHCDADVVVSLPYEAGREAFRAIAGVHEPWRAVERGRGARRERRALRPESRPALHRIERELFQPEPPSRSPRVTRSGSTRPAARGRRSSWPRPACSTCCGPAARRATSRSYSASRATTRRSWSRSSRHTGFPTRSRPACRLRTRPWGVGCWRCCAAPAWTAAPTTYCPGCEHRTPGAARACGPARGRRARGGGPYGGRGPRDLGVHAQPLGAP